MVAGAVSMLSCIPSSREICVSEELLAGLVAALMASSRFQTPRSQQAISMVGLTYCMRFMRPPALSKAQVCSSHQVVSHYNFFRVPPNITDWVVLADYLAFMCHLPVRNWTLAADRALQPTQRETGNIKHLLVVPEISLNSPFHLNCRT